MRHLLRPTLALIMMAAIAVPAQAQSTINRSSVKKSVNVKRPGSQPSRTVQKAVGPKKSSPSRNAGRPSTLNSRKSPVFTKPSLPPQSKLTPSPKASGRINSLPKTNLTRPKFGTSKSPQLKPKVDLGKKLPNRESTRPLPGKLPNGNGFKPLPGKLPNGNVIKPLPGKLPNGNVIKPLPGKLPNGNVIKPLPGKLPNGNVIKPLPGKLPNGNVIKPLPGLKDVPNVSKIKEFNELFKKVNKIDIPEISPEILKKDLKLLGPGRLDIDVPVDAMARANKAMACHFGGHRHCDWWVNIMCGWYYRHYGCHWTTICFTPGYWDCWTPCRYRIVYCPPVRGQARMAWYLGLECMLIPDLHALGVQEVAAMSPAHFAGLEPGDMILSVNGFGIDSENTLSDVIRNSDGIITLEVFREGLDAPVAIDIQLRRMMVVRY
ncbi:MAG: PDZ domain-containing protein [Planctomycetota bacterium]|nr:PDZ domain-containing protein [Planctomycetota bacterium]